MARSFRFYLGTHHPNWLWKGGIDVPLFVSARTLGGLRSFQPSTVPWALDSGGFSELTLFGGWVTTERQYVGLVRRYEREIGNLLWCAPQDWMCEPQILAKTGLTVKVHQSRTVRSFLHLANAGLPVIPVIQGYTPEEYFQCIDLYARHGVFLSREPLVGLGSVCRRQSTDQIAELIRTLCGFGIRLHGFGVKTAGLQKIAASLRSADSLSWSYRARHDDPLPGHEVFHKNCANCPEYALRWRERLLQGIVGASASR